MGAGRRTSRCFAELAIQRLDRLEAALEGLILATPAPGCWTTPLRTTSRSPSPSWPTDVDHSCLRADAPVFVPYVDELLSSNCPDALQMAEEVTLYDAVDNPIPDPHQAPLATVAQNHDETPALKVEPEVSEAADADAFYADDVPPLDSHTMVEHPRWEEFLLFCGRLHSNVRYAISLDNFMNYLGAFGPAVPMDAISAGSLASVDEDATGPSDSLPDPPPSEGPSAADVQAVRGLLDKSIGIAFRALRRLPPNSDTARLKEFLSYVMKTKDAASFEDAQVLCAGLDELIRTATL